MLVFVNDSVFVPYSDHSVFEYSYPHFPHHVL